MNEGYFNADQLEYMRELAAMPADQKCKCGWYRKRACPNCKPEDGGIVRTSTQETEQP